MEKLKYRDIIMYLYLKGFRAKQIDKDTFNTFGEQSPSCTVVTNWITILKQANLLLKVNTDQEGYFLFPPL